MKKQIKKDKIFIGIIIVLCTALIVISSMFARTLYLQKNLYAFNGIDWIRFTDIYTPNQYEVFEVSKQGIEGIVATGYTQNLLRPLYAGSEYFAEISIGQFRFRYREQDDYTSYHVQAYNQLKMYAHGDMQNEIASINIANFGISNPGYFLMEPSIIYYEEKIYAWDYLLAVERLPSGVYMQEYPQLISFKDIGLIDLETGETSVLINGSDEEVAFRAWLDEEYERVRRLGKMLQEEPALQGVSVTSTLGIGFENVYCLSFTGGSWIPNEAEILTIIPELEALLLNPAQYVFIDVYLYDLEPEEIVALLMPKDE